MENHVSLSYFFSGVRHAETSFEVTHCVRTSIELGRFPVFCLIEEQWEYFINKKNYFKNRWYHAYNCPYIIVTDRHIELLVFFFFLCMRDTSGRDQDSRSMS